MANPQNPMRPSQLKTQDHLLLPKNLLEDYNHSAGTEIYPTPLEIGETITRPYTDRTEKHWYLVEAGNERYRTKLIAPEMDPPEYHLMVDTYLLNADGEFDDDGLGSSVAHGDAGEGYLSERVFNLHGEDKDRVRLFVVSSLDEMSVSRDMYTFSIVRV